MPWELLHPLSSEDVLRAPKKMKDHSAGLDSRKLSDKKGIPAEEWPGHFNLWLLAGNQLRRGGRKAVVQELSEVYCTVLLPNGRVLQWFAQKVSGKFIF